MTTGYRWFGAGSAMLVAMAGLLVSTGRAHADDPVMHHVKYTISTQKPIYADIYYIDQEPAMFSDYSHNPYSVHAATSMSIIGPGQAVELRSRHVETRRLRDGRGEHRHGARHAGASL